MRELRKTRAGRFIGQLRKRIIRSIMESIVRVIPDTIFIKSLYKKRIGKKLNLKNPVSYNEKLQWLKLYDRNPLYTRLADKYEVRQYVTETIGEQYLIPLIGVWDRFDDIDFAKLPNQFVLKCTHDSGSIVICKDKTQFDIRKAGKRLNEKLKHNYYWIGREWSYKNIKPRIIAEEYLEDESGALMDYKVHCFGGNPRVIQVDFDRFIYHKRNIYTPEWELIDASYKYPNNKERIISKPDMLDEMLRLSNMIATNTVSDFIRVDWFDVCGKFYIGEFTFTPESGMGKFIPESYDALFGSWIDLSKTKLMATKKINL